MREGPKVEAFPLVAEEGIAKRLANFLAMLFGLIGAAAIIAVAAFVLVAIRHIRAKRTSVVAEAYGLYSESHGQIVARSLREHSEIGTESDPLDATAEDEEVHDRLLEPPEWPDALSTRGAERAGVG